MLYKTITSNRIEDLEQFRSSTWEVQHRETGERGCCAPQNQEKSKLEHDVEEQVDSSSVAQLTPPSELDSMQSGLFQFPE